MGQKACKCVKAESADGDRGDVYALPENPPVQSTADSRDHSPPPAGATDGDVGVNRDAGRKKRRFWRKFWKKRRRSAPGEREEQTIHQNTSAPSTADARDPSPRPAADVHEEKDENRDEGKKKKKKKKKKRRFWKRLWRKSHRGAQIGSDRCPEDQILETPELPNEDVNVIYEINSCQYEMGETLSKAGNISVYEATRVSDGLKVAVKIVQKVSPVFNSIMALKIAREGASPISIPGHPNPLPREIALHILANEGEHVPEIIRLLDWEDRYCEYFMVLEHPSPCMDLFKFIESRRGKISEDLARIIMRQAVKAVSECFKRGVFHMDFILENFLINTETLNVKLIDFAHGDLLKESCYTKFLGTPDYMCPELEEVGEYHALPATVWSLGLMLYVTMFWALPGIITLEQINNQQWEKDDLSTEFCRFINTCLQDDPHQRIQLKDVLLHEWFQVSGVEMIDSRLNGVSEEDQMQETPELLNETDDLTEAGDLQTSHHSSVSDSSDEGLYTSALSLFDFHVNVPQHTVSSGSDSESVDGFNTAVCSVSDLLQNNGNENVIYKINSSQYKMGKMLGIGGFGFVYEATRVSDGLKVAVKITRQGYSSPISIHGHPNPLPREIALHILANEGAKLSEIIRLLDWEEREDKYIMVLEHPSPCMDLHEFMDCHGGAIREKLAKSIMRQAIQAAIECFKRGVFHRDVKLENFLINTKTFEVKLIDFGCGDLLKKTGYTILTGTPAYCCPEMFKTDGYHALPATVWSLGLMLYRLVCGKPPEKYILHWINDKNWYRQDLTKECCKFINACLQQDPGQRIQIKDILFHEWFQV